MADLFWSPCLTHENFSRILDLADVERLKGEGGADEGAIFACLHYGGFEWIALALGLSGLKCTVVTQAFKNPRSTPPSTNCAKSLAIRRSGGKARFCVYSKRWAPGAA